MPFATELTLKERSGGFSVFDLSIKKRHFREIVFLKEFGSHPNIIQLLNVHRAANDKDLYLVFEFMETDLHHVIKKGNILKGIHRQYIMYQLFKVNFFSISFLQVRLVPHSRHGQATQFLHSGNVIHRDQKPSNILLDSQVTIIVKN